MRLPLLFIGLLFYIPLCTGWGGRIGKDHYVSQHGAVHLDYGRSYARFATPFQDHFKSQYGSSFAGEMQVFSLGVTSPVWIGNGIKSDRLFDANFGLNHKRTPAFYSGDTATYRLTALDFNFAIGYDLFFFWDHIDLPIRLGWDFGMAHLEKSGEHNRNPFFDLIVQVQPRIILWKIALSAKAEIGYDITSRNWKPKKNGMNDLMPFKNNYGLISFSVGYVFE